MVTEQPPPTEFAIEVPADLETGSPADFASVWHTPTTFVIDFIAMKAPPSPTTGTDGSTVLQVQSKVVSRVRIPPSQVFEIARVLTQQLDAWEKETGAQGPKEGNDPQ